MTNVEKAKKYLASLGTSVASVVKKLKASHIKGHREDYDLCPIAMWLSKKMPKCDVGITNTDFVCEGEGKLPLAVRRFIKDFDKGKYPELEELNFHE